MNGLVDKFDKRGWQPLICLRKWGVQGAMYYWQDKELEVSPLLWAILHRWRWPLPCQWYMLRILERFLTRKEAACVAFSTHKCLTQKQQPSSSWISSCSCFSKRPVFHAHKARSGLFLLPQNKKQNLHPRMALLQIARMIRASVLPVIVYHAQEQFTTLFSTGVVFNIPMGTIPTALNLICPFLFHWQECLHQIYYGWARLGWNRRAIGARGRWSRQRL